MLTLFRTFLSILSMIFVFNSNLILFRYVV